MNLRDKTLIVIFPVLAVTVVALYFSSREIFTPGFERIEAQNLDDDTRRASGALMQMLETLDLTAQDWARRDDTYAFIADRNTNYMTSDLNEESLSGIRLNLIALMNAAGDPVFESGLDDANRRFLPYPEEARALLRADSPLFARCLSGETLKGLANLNAGPALISARPILTSRGEGPARGVLLMGQYLDEEELATLRRITRLAVDLRPASDPEFQSQLMIARAKSKGDTPYYEPDENTARGFAVLPALLDKDGLILRVTVSRDIDRLATTTLRAFVISLIIVGVVASAIIAWLLQTLIMGRLSRLGSEVGRLGSHGLSERLTVTGTDELSRVGRAINEMLASLERAQHEVSVQDERYRHLVEKLPDIVYTCGLDGNLLSLNPAFEKITGWPVVEWIGRSPSEFRHPDDIARAEATLRGTLETGVPFSMQTRMKVRSGAWHFMETSGSPLVEDGRVTGIQGIVRDITERHLDEERRQALAAGLHGVVAAADELIACDSIEELYRRAVELAREKLLVERCAIFLLDGSMARGTFGIDMSGRVVDESGNSFELVQEWEEHFGTISPEKPRWVLKENVDQWNWDGVRSSVIGNGWVSYTAIARGNGRAMALFIRDAAISKAPFDRAKQEVVSVYCSLLAEIIERKHSEIALRESELRFRALSETLEQRVEERTHAAIAANRAKSQFLASMSHELRTPLNSIIGFSELLTEKKFGALNDRQQRYVQNVTHSGRHLLQLINDILDLSKVDAGRTVLEPSLFDLQKVIGDAVTVVATMARRKSIVIESRIAPNLAFVSLDEAKFRQILHNLLGNAVKFTREGGHVTVTAAMEPRSHSSEAPAGPCLRVAVTDTGIGIKLSDQERIFDEFVQVDSGYARNQEGTGLGLSLVRRLVELQGGRIRVESEGVEGHGTTFTIEFPMPDDDVATPPPPGNNGDRDGAPLLLVDDDPATIEVVTRALGKVGFRTLRAADGREGIARALECRPRVVIIDMVMAGLSGMDAVQELRSLPATRNTPIVMFTGHQIDDDKLERVMSYVQAVVYKPDLHELIRVVTQLAGVPS